MKTYCRACRALLADGATFCQACGAKLAETAPLPASNCPSCGAILIPGAGFCRDCGAPVVAVARAAAAALATVRGQLHGHAMSDSVGQLAGKPALLPRSEMKSAPAASPGRGLRKPLLGVAVLALLGLSLWQWIDHDEVSSRYSGPVIGSSERSASTPASLPPLGSNTPYDVEGIEGIVDIDAADIDPSSAAGAASAAVIHEATAKLPDLQTQAQAGNSRAMTSLALTQRSGLAGRADPLSAIALLQRAAAAGDRHAMTALAEEYESGIWIEQDPRKAQALRVQAAQAGSRLAQWELEP